MHNKQQQHQKQFAQLGQQKINFHYIHALQYKIPYMQAGCKNKQNIQACPST